MSKWTPGPWGAYEVGYGHMLDGTKIGIFEVRDSVGHRNVCKSCYEDDGRLIAAAPEMAELLERLDIAERDAITGEGAAAHLRVLAEEARALLARIDK